MTETKVRYKRKHTPFEKAIRKRLIDRDMTIRQLEDAIGSGRNYIHLIFNGYRPATRYVKSIEKVLDLNLSKHLREDGYIGKR